MGAEQERSGIDQQNPQRLPAAPPVELGRTVGTEHSPADDDGVEGEPAVAQRRLDLVPVIADVAPEHVVAELRLLNLDPVGGIRRGHKSGKVGRVLRHQAFLT